MFLLHIVPNLDSIRIVRKVTDIFNLPDIQTLEREDREVANLSNSLNENAAQTEAKEKGSKDDPKTPAGHEFYYEEYFEYYDDGNDTTNGTLIKLKYVANKNTRIISLIIVTKGNFELE